MPRIALLSLCLIALWVVCPTPTSAQERGTLTGQVLDEETGLPIVGASVVITGTSIGAATDIEGRYRIPGAPAGEQTILVRSLSFEPKNVAVVVLPDQAVTLDVFLAPQVTEFGEIQVIGTRKSQLDAISQRRQSPNLREVLTSDDLGRLPDINVAEAAQRAAGVALETDKGEGRFVSIRGISPTLNNVTLDNRSNLASSAGSRAVALDLMPTEVISSIEVVKAVTPDMEANAVGGTLNINTLSAFERPRPFVIFSVDGLMHERQNTENFGDVDVPFRIAGTVGRRFGTQQKLGMVLSANYFKRDYTVSVTDPDEWIYENGFFLPNENEIQLEDNERARFGLDASLEYRFSDDRSVYLKSFFSQTREVALNSEFELTFEGDLQDQTATSGLWTGGSMELDLSRDEEVERLTSVLLGTRQRWGALELDVYGSFARGTTDESGPDGTFENPGDTEEQIPLRYDLSRYLFDVRPATPEAAAFAANPDIMVLRSLNLNRRNVFEDNYEISADLRYDLMLGDYPAYLKAGGRYRDRRVEADLAQTEYELGAGGVQATDPYTLGTFRLDPWVPEQGGQRPFHHGDAAAFATFFGQSENLSNPTRIVLDEVGSRIEDVQDDYRNSETVTAGYLMGQVNLGRLTLLGGARVEHTATTANSRLIAADADADAISFDDVREEHAYTHVLPSLHLKALLTDHLVARAAWTHTIGRPDYRDLAATAEFEYEETTTPGVYVGSLNQANADLDPFESLNLDASLEYYLGSGGMISAGGFFKRIDNQIFVNEEEHNDVTFRGLFFEELQIQQLDNANRARLWGAEFIYDQAFLFLPGVLKGFGTSLNLALIESEVTLDTRPGQTLPLFRQPSQVFNGVLYFQREGLEIRLAASHRSDMLLSAASVFDYEDEIAAGADIARFDRWEDGRTTLDLLVGYTFSDRGVRITGQVRNLTNAPEQYYQGLSSRLDRYQLTGRTFFLGVNVSL